MENNLSTESFGYKQELKRALTIRDIVFFGIMFMGPASCMTLFGIMHVSSNGHAPTVYLLAFVVALFTALSYGQMVEAFPIAGSTYSYTQRGVHPALGFLSGWTIILDYFFTPVMLYLVCASFANALLPNIPIWVWVLIFAIPAIIINILGVEVAAKINIVCTAGMYLAMITFIVLAIITFATGKAPAPLSFKPFYDPATFNFKIILGGVGLALVSYIGFDAMTTLSEEVKDSGSKIKVGIIVTLVIAVITYLVTTYFETILAPPASSVTNPDALFYQIASMVASGWFQLFSSIIFIIAAWATVLCGQAASARILYGMGRDKLLPKFFASVHPKYKTPFKNIILLGFLAIIGAEAMSLTLVSEMVSFGALFGFACVNLAVIVHFFFRKKTGRFFAHLIIPALGLLVCIYVLTGLSSLCKTIGLIWLGLGILYLVIRSAISKDFKDNLANVTFKETM